VTYADLNQEVTTNGSVIPTNEFQARAFWPGIIEKVSVELGERVRPGQLLVTMKDPFAISQMTAADAALQAAQVSDDNLHKGGSQEERINLEGDLQRARQTQMDAARALAALKALAGRGAASRAEVASAEQRLETANVTLRTLKERAAGRYSAARGPAASGTFSSQTRAYLAMLGTESSAGASMNSASHEALPVVAQITSLNSILGFWLTNSMIRGGLTCLLLLVLGALLIRRTRLVDTERGALLAIGAWCSMGMLATYHRAHDASLLILLVPWVISRIRDTPLRWPAWTAVALYCGMSVSLDFPVVLRLVGTAPQHSLLSFLLLRQVALSNLLLLLVLFMTMSDEHVNEQRYSGADAQSDDANLRAA
jgi:hypothetical protein